MNINGSVIRFEHINSIYANCKLYSFNDKCSMYNEKVFHSTKKNEEEEAESEMMMRRILKEHGDDIL